MKKLWNVTVSTETMVVAETREEAEKVARLNLRQYVGYSYSAAESTYLAGGWESDCVPYGYDVGDERTVGEYLSSLPSGGSTEKR